MLHFHSLNTAEIQERERKLGLILTSEYFSFNSPDPPPTVEFKNLLAQSGAGNAGVLIGVDANAHYTAGGSTGTNM